MLSEAIISEAISIILNLAVEGTKALIKTSKESKEKLIKVYLELKNNKSILEQSGILNEKGISYDDKVFISVAKKLKNKEISPLYKFNKKRFLFPNRKNAIKQRKTQYEINFIITKIDHLKNIGTVKRKSAAPKLRLSYQLKTLYKHLNTIEKVLLPVGKKR